MISSIPSREASLTEKFDFWLSLLSDVEHRSDGQYVACCPAHQDAKRSLSTRIGDKGIVATCFAGCKFPQICHSAGVTATWMFTPEQDAPVMREVAHWVYRDEFGEPVFRTVRKEDGTIGKDGKKNKEFVQQRPDGNGGWINGVKGVRVVPYRLEHLWLSTGPVLIVEGEKHCDRLAELGFTATCNAGGAAVGNGKNKWRTGHSEFLRGRHVVILPDNDKPGREHAQNVSESLKGIAASVRVATLSSLPEKGDVIDFIDAGGTKEQIQQAIDEAKPIEELFPADPRVEGDGESSAIPPIANYKMDWSGEEPKTLALPINEIITEVHGRSGGFPKRIDTLLFAENADRSVSWLQNTPSLFGWIGAVSGHPADFKRMSHLHSQGEVFSELQRTAEAFAAVETLPHFPKMPRHYYACDFPQPGDGSTLAKLVERYAPETPIDADLITAMFVTLFWGGEGGTRPVFVITSDAGRGAGKSTLSQHVALLVNGAIELSPNEDFSQIKQRLLSPEGMRKRVAIIDNLKALRFSWAEFEGLVTAVSISGKRMYVGEGERPGTITYVVTVNGASFGHDIAQRSVVIKLCKPQRTGTWAEETRRFIIENRNALIADCLGILQGPQNPLAKSTRWGDWEENVLRRLPEPDEIQRVIIDRQQIVNSEDDEAGIIQEGIAAKLRGLGYFPDCERVFLPSQVMATWFNEIMKERLTTTAVSRKLKQGIDEGTFPRLSVNRNNTPGRGFIWEGIGINPGTTLQKDIEARLSEQKTDNCLVEKVS